MGEREGAGLTGAERSERNGKPMSRAPWGPRQGPHFSGAEHALASGAERRASEKGGACPAGSLAAEASVVKGRVRRRRRGYGGQGGKWLCRLRRLADRQLPAARRWREAV